MSSFTIHSVTNMTVTSCCSCRQRSRTPPAAPNKDIAVKTARPSTASAVEAKGNKETASNLQAKPGASLQQNTGRNVTSATGSSPPMASSLLAAQQMWMVPPLWLQHCGIPSSPHIAFTGWPHNSITSGTSVPNTPPDAVHIAAPKTPISK